MMDDAFQRRSMDFLSWLKQQEGVSISPKIELADMRSCGTGRGVSMYQLNIAIEDIAEDEELFSIPRSLILSAHNSDLRKHLSNELATLDPWLSLVLVMMYESGKGQSSRWKPYWDILPETFETLMYWSDSELAQLQGSAVLGKIGKEGAEDTFLQVLLPLATKHAELFGEHASQLSGPNMPAFFLSLAHRMATLVGSYAFDLEKDEKIEDEDEDGFLEDDEDNPQKGMVPLADMLSADGEKNNARLYHEETCLTMTATENIRKGEEIFNHYGSLPRSDLLRRFGYITDNYKKWDVVEIETAKMMEVAATERKLSIHSIERRVELAQNWDVWENTFDISREDASHGIELDPNLVSTLSLLSVGDAIFKEMRSLKKPPEMAISTEMASILRETLALRQQDYNTTIAEDRNLLHNTELQKRYRQAIEIRLGEKEVLQSMINHLDMVIAGPPEQSESHMEGHVSKKHKT